MIAINILARVVLFSILVMPFNNGKRQHSPFTSFDIELNGTGAVNIRGVYSTDLKRFALKLNEAANKNYGIR